MDNNQKEKREKGNLETGEMKFLRSVAGYTRKYQTRHTKILEGLNIFNLNVKLWNPDHNGSITCDEWKTGGFRRIF
jgi:hypothetical protein